MKSRKEIQFEQREQDILEISLQLFLKYGLEKVHVDHIAKEVGVAKGTVYKHFKSKEEIFAHLFIGFAHKLIERLRGLDQSLPVVDQIRNYIFMYLDFTFSDGEESELYERFRKVLVQSKISQALRDRIQEQEQFLYRFAEEMMQKGIDDGVLRDLPVHYLVCIGDCMLQGMTEIALKGHYASVITDRKELFHYVGDVLLNGILRR